MCVTQILFKAAIMSIAERNVLIVRSIAILTVAYTIRTLPYVCCICSLLNLQCYPQSPTQWSPFSVRRISATTQKSVQIWKDLIFFTFNFCSVKWQSEWMCMLEIRLIMDELTNSNDKEKKRIYLFYCHFNRNNSVVSVLSPRGPDSCH